MNGEARFQPNSLLFSLFWFFEKVGRFNPERRSDLLQNKHRRIADATLNAADVGAMQAAFKREPFLGKLPLLAVFPNVVADPLPYIHTCRRADMNNISLQTISLNYLDFLARPREHWENETEEQLMGMTRKNWIAAGYYALVILTVSNGAALISYEYGSYLAWAAVVGAAIAIMDPMEPIGLGHPGVGALALVSALLALFTVGQIDNFQAERQLAALKIEDPAQYRIAMALYVEEERLAELKKTSPVQYKRQKKDFVSYKHYIRNEERRAAKRVEEAEEAAESAEDRCRSSYARILAYNTARQFVAQQLRSPSTAEFPSSSNTTISSYGECSFSISGYVDAQNGFGAMVRSHYTAEITRNGEHGWRFSGVEFL